MIRTLFQNTSLIRSRNRLQFYLSTMSEMNLTTPKVEEENVKTENGQPAESEKRPEYKWKKAKKMAAMISFSGKDYIGMQRNAGFKTIEGEFLAALSRAGIIDPEWEEIPQKGFFQRASRTDKGVSALKMVVSLKMAEEEGMVEKVNAELPTDIKLQAVVRVTKEPIKSFNFNCKSAADARTYLYVLPTFAFSPTTEIIRKNSKPEDWRCEPDTIANVNSVLKEFIGSRYFHNYTSGKLPLEPSSQRFIHQFECGEPFIKDGYEWCIIRVKGQSFMLHQIRKMIGMALGIVRGHTDLAALEQTWGMDRIDIPRAPGLGLVLEEVHYDRYNKRYGSDGIHDTLSWEKVEEQVETFKQDIVFADIFQTEMETKSMFEWMAVLPMHKFEPRHFEEDGPRSPLAIAKANVEREQGKNGVKVDEEEEDE